MSAHPARRRELPRLAWLLGRALAGARWWQRPAAPVLAVVLAPMLLSVGYSAGQVWCTRHAVVVIEQRTASARRVLVALRGLVPALGLISALTVWSPVAELVALVVVLGVLAPSILRERTARKDGHSLPAAVRAGEVPEDADVVVILAAWPFNSGNAAELLRGVLPALADHPRPLAAVARTDALAHAYARHAGMRPIKPGSRVVLR